MAYNTRARPRPEGGEAQAIRGLYAMLKAKFDSIGFPSNPPFLINQPLKRLP